MKLISSSCSFPLPFYNIFSQKNFPWFSHHIEICARKCGRGSVRELGPRKVTVKTGQKHKKKNGDLNGGVCVFIRFSDEDSL